MRGTIVSCINKQRRGVIKVDESDIRYFFMYKDFKAMGYPKVGLKVEFTAKGNKAFDVYKDVSASIGRVYKERKFNSFRTLNSGKRLEALFENGMFNKFGLYISIAMLVCLMLPIIDVDSARVKGVLKIADVWQGKIAFVLLIVSCIFFYGGIKRFYLQILNGIITLLVLSSLLEVFSWINEFNKMVQDVLSPSIGMILCAVTLVLFVYFTYIHNPYNQNQKTF